MFPNYHHHRTVERELGRIRDAAEATNAHLEDLARTPEERALRRTAAAERQAMTAWLVGVPFTLIVLATVLGRALGLGGRLVWFVVAGLGYLVAAAIPLMIVVGVVGWLWSVVRPSRGPTEPPH